jgi:hypothetical protein
MRDSVVSSADDLDRPTLADDHWESEL